MKLIIANAVQVVYPEQRVSVSMIQRRFALGYTAASEVVDEMSRLGLIGPPKPMTAMRDVLVDREEWTRRTAVEEKHR